MDVKTLPEGAEGGHTADSAGSRAGAVLALWGSGGPQADGNPGGTGLPTEGRFKSSSV